VADLTYGICNFVQRTALRLFADWQLQGRENVPPRGPLIVVSNHISNLDPQLLACSIPRRLRFVAKRGLFKPVASFFFRAYGAYPMNRDGNDLAAALWLRKVLARDGAVVLFPETTRSGTPGMQRGVPGVALIALRTQAPILPVGIIGSECVGPPWQTFFPHGTIRVNIGQPFTLPAMEGRVERPQLEALTTMIMERVAAQLPKQYRGVYQLTPPKKVSTH
jgi:1-acyl-sn-glycerol-3-phosphate acyltransferase